MLALIRQLAHAASIDGVDLESIFQNTGIGSEALVKGMDADQMDMFLAALCRAASTTGIGLKAAQHATPERFGPVNFLAMFSPTLGAALKRLARHSRHNWGDLIEFSQWGHRATLRLTSLAPDRPYTIPRADLELASISAFARSMTTKPVYPTHVTIAGSPPQHADQYKDALGCWPKFNQTDTMVVFRAEDMDTPLVTANGELESMFESFVEETLQNSGRTRTAERARLAAMRLLRDSFPTIESVAKEMFVSTRTLQRRLACEGLTFSDVLNEVRMEIAKQRLASGVSTSVEISAAIGFHDPNSFFRAFKRWTGQTPEQFRRSTGKPSMPNLPAMSTLR